MKFQAQLHSFVPDSSASSFSNTKKHIWHREWRLQSICNASSLLLLSHTFPLLQHRSFPWAAVLQELLQRGSFFTGCSPSGPSPACLPHRPQFLPENLLLHGLLSTSCTSCQKPAPVWALHGLQLPWEHIRLLWHGVLHRLQRDNLLHLGLLHGVKGLLCSGAWSTTPTPSLLTLVTAGLFLSLVTFLSLTTPTQHFLPFLKYVITQALQMLLTGSAFGSSPFWSQLEPALSNMGTCPGIFSRRPQLQPSAAKVLSCKPDTPSFFENSAVCYVSAD